MLAIKDNSQVGSEYNLEEIVQHLPAAIYLCDSEGYITYYNQAATILWGRKPVIGKDMWCGSWKIYWPDGTRMPLDECPMAISLKEGRAVRDQEIVVERPDGSRYNILPYPEPVFDTAGKITGAFNMLVDITAIKAAEEALFESEDRFSTLAKEVPIVIWLCDENGDFVYLSKRWNILTGQTPSKGYGTGWLDFLHPGDRARVADQWAKAFAEREAFDSRFRFPAGEGNYSILRASGTPRYNAVGGFTGYIGLLQDITLQEETTFSLKKEVRERADDILKKNEELVNKEALYHLMIDEVQDYALLLLNKDGRIENWNKGAEKIKGYKAEEIIGENFRIFYTKEDREKGLPEKLISEAIVDGKANHEGWRLKKDGTVFWGYIVITALHDKDNQVIGFSKVTRDLTERKIAEEGLKEKSALLEKQNKHLEKLNEELSSFAYISSHDLQEPLRKIRTFTSYILSYEMSRLSEKGKDYFHRMLATATRMQDLIQDILTYSRTNNEEISYEPTDLAIILQNVRDELRETIIQKEAIIESYPLPVLDVVSFQLHQLFTNLLSNALKYSRQGVPPHIVIRATILSGAEIADPRANAKGKYHHITFTDNGIGFEPGNGVKIFDIFKRLHGRDEYSGTGIGLAICKKIVENHDGFITAQGELNKGAVMHIYLPVF